MEDTRLYPENEKPLTQNQPSIMKLRRLFREAVDASDDWQREAKEDYNFVAGKQWTDEEKEAFRKLSRPAITVNRIKPLMNILSGYQRLNRYDIDFLPRTEDDISICEVRKALTKYILDRSDYEANESQVFLDAVIGGIGWFEVGYKIDDETGDGEAFVKREDPFSVYIDPEAHTRDFSDAKHIFRAKWVDKDELILQYPEKKDAIEAQYAVYDVIEKEEVTKQDPLWYKKDLKKARLVECWYKKKRRITMCYLADGTSVELNQLPIEAVYNGLVVGTKEFPKTEVRCAVFVDEVLLEDIISPYQHGEFPLVPLVCYNFSVGDVPAGIVRDLKDPQREINRRRIQELHILNNSGDGGHWIEEDAMTPEQWRDYEEHGTTPGHAQKVIPGALSQGKIQPRATTNPPLAIIQAETQATQDLTAISGINESLMGTDVPSGSSGRAIELKQKQAITHIAPLFDELRNSKKKVAYLLWGKRNHPGIVPEFYTEDKVYRIEGKNGQQFLRVNEQVIQQDPMGQVIVSTLNDLSQGEFDIVIADTNASTTQRQAQLWGLVDAVSRLQIPGDLVFDIVLELSDLPNKEAIKERWQQKQQQAAEQSQAQMELERIKNENMHQSIAFKDAPLPIQLAMAAKQGLIDPQVAEYAINLMVQNMFPQLAEGMAKQRQMQQQAQMAQEQMAQMQQAQQGGQMAQMPQNNQGGQPQMTQAAMKSLMSGMTPAAL